MKKQLVAVAGFKNSGKDTVGNYLISNHGFKKESFANPLKDTCAAVFGWPRDLLEGNTEESRAWREQEDTWWAKRLGMPGLSPRRALQLVGTEVFRNHFHDAIWIASLENRFLKQEQSIVVTDCRFSNELEMVRRLNGVVIQVDRGPRPEWWDLAAHANLTQDQSLFDRLENEHQSHASEYSWVGFSVDYRVENNGTIEDLYQELERVYLKI